MLSGAEFLSCNTGSCYPQGPFPRTLSRCFYWSKTKSVSPLLPVLRNPTALHFQRPEQFACDVLHGARCLGGTILPRWTVGQRAAHYQAGKAFELQPSSRDMQETTAQQKTLVCIVCYGKNPDGDGPPPAQSPGLFP